jgi:hypothetical protein
MFQISHMCSDFLLEIAMGNNLHVCVDAFAVSPNDELLQQTFCLQA